MGADTRRSTARVRRRGVLATFAKQVMTMGAGVEVRIAHASRRRQKNPGGFTLLDLTFAIACAAVLVGIAVPSYMRYVARARTAAAVADIGKIHLAVDSYRISNNDAPPPDLASIGMAAMLDPWGRPYVYLSFNGLKGKGAMRKDKNLVPINTEYDLYSVGPDGASVPPLTAKPSRDDIVMANDGGFIGPASDY
jgi:general secretion pathway protein G